MGPTDVKIRVLRAGLCGTDLHLEQWDDWAAVDGARRRMTHRPRVLRRGRRGGRGRHQRRGRATASPVRATSSAASAATAAPAAATCASTPRASGSTATAPSPTTSSSPRATSWVQPDDLDPDLGAVFDPLGNATHTALSVPDGRRGRGHHRRRPDRRDGGRDRPPRRRPARRRHRRQRLPPRARQERRRRPRRSTSAASNLREAQAELGMKEGFDIGLEMSGSPAAVEDMLANMNHGGRVAMLGLPQGPLRHRLGPGHHPHDHHQGHLRPRDVRHLVRHELDARRPRRSLRERVVVRSSPTASPPSSGRRPSTRPGRASAARSSSTGAEPPRPEPFPPKRTDRMYGAVKDELLATLAEIEAAGLYKHERELTSPQSAHVTTAKAEALNFCANNYLGLADHPDVVAAAAQALDEWGFGMASVSASSAAPRRCTSELEHAISRVPRHRGDDPLLLVLRRQRRRLRGALRRRGRDHLRRAQPRLDHRRHPAVQGRRGTATRNADMADLRGAARGRARPARAARSSSPTACSRWTATSPRSTRSATSPTSTARWSWSTTPTPWASSATAAAAPPSSSA